MFLIKCEYLKCLLIVIINLLLEVCWIVIVLVVVLVLVMLWVGLGMCIVLFFLLVIGIFCIRLVRIRDFLYVVNILLDYNFKYYYKCFDYCIIELLK